MTYGYITKCDREGAGLEKTHCIDARCISGNPNAEPNGRVYKMTKCRCHDRQTHEAIAQKRYHKRRCVAVPHLVFGYRHGDVVEVNGRIGFVQAVRTRGYFVIGWFDGLKATDGFSYKRLKLVQHSKSIDIR